MALARPRGWGVPTWSGGPALLETDPGLLPPAPLTLASCCRTAGPVNRGFFLPDKWVHNRTLMNASANSRSPFRVPNWRS